ncbi:MAG: DUF4091 domain-containing protein [bacterium]|nr:DUF4091 domain-containing protein [bacterium]
MKKTPCLLIVTVLGGFCAFLPESLAQAQSDGAFRVVEVKTPARVRGGERVVGNVTLEVVQPGAPPFTRPFASFRSLVDTDVSVNLPASKHTPWKIPGPHQAGDRLNVAFTLDVPLDVPPGPAEFGFQVARHPEGRAWEYAPLQDQDGGPVGGRFTWKVTIAAKESVGGANAVDVPLVVGRMAHPTIDGRVNPEEWSAAGAVDGFVENLKNTAAKAQTRAWVGHDDTTLFIAMVCEEPLPGNIAERAFDGRQDPPIWVNECVEVFLNPQGDRASHMHFLVDILNQRHDALGSDFHGFNPDWENAVWRGATEWSAEIAIPFLALGVEAPTPGDVWYANLCRERKAEQELSAWHATFGAFNAPGRFGSWVFDSLKTRLAKDSEDLVADSPQWPEEMQQHVAQWQGRHGAWTQTLSTMDEIGVRDAYARLSSELDVLRKERSALRLKAARLSGETFAVARAWPYERFLGEPSSLDRPAGPIEVALLRDEWVDLAWNVTNLSDQPLTLRCTSRHSEDDKSWNYLKLGIPGFETLWQESVPVAAPDGTQVYDVLAPRPAGILHLAPGETGQMWLSIHNSGDGDSNTKARIVFQPVDGSPGTPVEVPLVLRAIPASIASARSIHCFTWNLILPEVAEAQPRWFQRHLDDLASHGVDVCMLHRLRTVGAVKANADGTLAGKPDFTHADVLLDATMDAFNQYFVTLGIWEKGKQRRDLFGLDFGTPEYEKAFKEWFGLVVDHLIEKGLTYDRFMVNPYDESVGEHCRTLSRWIKEVDPRVRVVIDCSTPDLDVARKMDALTDDWMPHFKTFFPDNMKPFHDMVIATGKPRWCYFYSEGSNDKLQDPTRHYLAKFWWAFANDVAGIGYWAQQYYGDPWYREAYKSAYDTSLVYPTETGLVPSRRWQAWRRGWQDHCLLSLARETFQDSGDEASVAKVEAYAADVASVPGDPARAEEIRAWLKQAVSVHGE